MLSRRRFSAALLSTAALGSARAQSEAPIHLLVGFPAGGGSDVIARLLAEKLQSALGRPVLVDNRPGAGGQIAAQQLKAARADGATLFLSHDHTISILPQVVKKPGYDPRVDFEPVGGFATFVRLREWPYLAVGVIGLTLAATEAAVDFFDGSGAAIGLLVAGSVLLITSLIAMRLRRGTEAA